jgi:hypothetical protein
MVKVKYVIATIVLMAMVVSIMVWTPSIVAEAPRMVVSADVSPLIGTVDTGYVHWNQSVVRVAWKGEYTARDAEILEETWFELEQATGLKFVVVDPVRGKPEILVEFNEPAGFGFPWEENWAGLTSIGWYPKGDISPCVMVYISTTSTMDESRKTCIQHEIGHAMGLGHINDGVAVMNSYIDGTQDYTAEDLKFLHMIYNK